MRKTDRRVFVSNLDYRLSLLDVKKLFKPFEVKDVYFPKRKGSDKCPGPVNHGMAFVEFKTPEQATAAVCLSGKITDEFGRKLKIEKHK
jgi:RNA recognition motif-containing protein